MKIGVPNTLFSRIKFPSTPTTRKLSGIMKSHRAIRRQGRVRKACAESDSRRRPGRSNRKLLGGKKTNQPKKNYGPACVHTRPFFPLEVLRVAGNDFSCVMFRPPGFRPICQWKLISRFTYQFHVESAGLELGNH